MFRMTILFDDQYWVALIEGEENGEGRVYRHIFGGEPSGPEVYLFVLYGLAELLRRPAATVEIAPPPPPRALNPKRRAREAARSTSERGVSAAAELALGLQRAAAKQERRASARAAREAEAAARYAKAQAKAREKRRGH
ncbi:MAG TPA: YjdF family protein [Herpetosiphonaceae bacterium]|nr:YjdF family protein [Herpetosiphonaceae bacterium]